MSLKSEREADLTLEMQSTNISLPSGKFSLMFVKNNIGVKNRVQYIRATPDGKDTVDWGWLLEDGNEIWHMAKTHVNYSEAPLIVKVIR